jgi:hypothetical protein
VDKDGFGFSQAMGYIAWFLRYLVVLITNHTLVSEDRERPYDLNIPNDLKSNIELKCSKKIIENGLVEVLAWNGPMTEKNIKSLLPSVYFGPEFDEVLNNVAVKEDKRETVFELKKDKWCGI